MYSLPEYTVQGWSRANWPSHEREPKASGSIWFKHTKRGTVSLSSHSQAYIVSLKLKVLQKHCKWCPLDLCISAVLLKD